MITAALAELGSNVVGLVVQHKGYPLQLFPDVENRGWSAFGMPDATDEDGDHLLVDGDGPTPLAALDACAAKCYEAESVDGMFRRGTGEQVQR